jgi:hypothetical protein
MMKSPLIAALAASLLCAAPVLAQEKKGLTEQQKRMQ